ncbi:MAG: DUF58 domain-containing protein [Bacteroidales bacterium]|nr:DUF58 domain-containing protein [Bacteroidales bacterium]
MEATDLIRRVRKIEIKSRGLSNQIFAGEYHSAFKGRGMAFSEVRDYQYGDDIRNIDWNVTARFNHPYVKVFEEERELTVMLLVDISGSREFGSTVQLKRSLMAEISAVLSFSAIQNNDKVGVILFSDQIEKFIPPKKGKKHILRVIRELIDFEPVNKGTDVTVALRYLTNAIKKKTTAFLISDFITPPFEEALKIAGRKHDMVALRIYDPREAELPPVGMMKISDAETGKRMWIDTADAYTRKMYAEHWFFTQQKIEETFRKCGTDHAIFRTDRDYVVPLMKLFKSR